MVRAYEKCIRKSSIWKTELEKQLLIQESDKVYANYEKIAQAFPSTMPHPSSFDFPHIDHESFVSWARERGWKVELIFENSNQRNEIPYVQFTRVS